MRPGEQMTRQGPGTGGPMEFGGGGGSGGDSSFVISVHFI